MKTFWLTLPLCFVLALPSCGSDDDGSGGATGGSGGTGGGTGGTAGASTGGTAGSATGGSGGSAGGGPFALTSSAYVEGGTIPEKYECEDGGGDNVSPPLAWGEGPAGTQSYAIVMRDLDFNNGFIHWVIWDIPAATLSLPENVEQVFQPSVPAGAKQAPFNGALIGYFGPCSPNSVNTYEMTLYALPDATLSGLDDNSTKAQAATAIEGAALASTTLSGES
jgi:Raf kinase inhibitor-like YbhB/YbcL family protein